MTALTGQIEIGDEAPTALYRFYDEAGALLYVGISRNLSMRWDRHARVQPWWSQVARKTVVLYATRAEAGKAEGRAARTENPVHNIQVPFDPEDPVRGVRKGLDHVPGAVTAQRERSGLTKREVANRLGVAPSLITAIENGSRNATPQVLIRLAEVFSCPVVALERNRIGTDGRWVA